jgi:hypothetical protein
MLAASVTPAATEAGASSPAAAAGVSPHATANVVSFRPRWFNNILTSAGSSSGSTAGRGGGDEDDSASSLTNEEDTRGVVLQSTGKPYDVRCHQRESISYLRRDCFDSFLFIILLACLPADPTSLSS